MSFLVLMQLSVSGGSRVFERGVQVQADYGNSMHCYIIAPIVTSWQARWLYMSMQRLQSRHPPARSAENFRVQDL